MLVILSLSTPEVLKAIVSTSGNLIFVFESPVWYIVSAISKLPATVKLSLNVVLPIKVGIVPVVVCIVPNEPVDVTEPLILPAISSSLLLRVTYWMWKISWCYSQVFVIKQDKYKISLLNRVFLFHSSHSGYFQL